MIARAPSTNGRFRPITQAWECAGGSEFGVRARVRRGLAGLARRSRLAWTGEEQLRLAMAAARMGTFEWDLRTNRGEMSPELEAIHGLAPGEFDGSREMMIELVHPADREEFLAGFARATAEGGRYETEFRIVLPSGEVRWRTAVATILNDADSTPWRIVGVGQDVTDRRVAEETLAEARARYQRMVEQLPLVTLRREPRRRERPLHQPADRGARRLHGRGVDGRPELLRQGAASRRPRPRPRRVRRDAPHRATCSTGEYRVVARDGRVVWVHDVAVRRARRGRELRSTRRATWSTSRPAMPQSRPSPRAGHSSSSGCATSSTRRCTTPSPASRTGRCSTTASSRRSGRRAAPAAASASC